MTSIRWKKKHHNRISGLNASSKTELYQNIKGMSLYEIVDGQRRKIHFSRNDLKSGKTLSTKGYISGVVLISGSPNMAAMLDGRQMELQAERPTAVADNSDYTTNAKEHHDTGQYYYTYFPQVMGDTVSPKDQFCISIHDGNAQQTLTIRQSS
jgi:hypothetical protein